MTLMIGNERTVPFSDEHRLYLHPHVDTAHPFDTAMDLTHNTILNRRYAVKRHTADAIVDRARRISVSAPRRSVPDWWGLVALLSGVVTVAAALTIALLALARR